MARDNETNTLELHIKGKNRKYRCQENHIIRGFNIFLRFLVNGQNLSAISEKCNVGTLRYIIVYTIILLSH